MAGRSFQMLTLISPEGIDQFLVYASIGVFAGLFIFFKGFRIYRRYRILALTPGQPIGAIAMGIVQVHGKARGNLTVTSPITNARCFLYEVKVRAKASSDKDSSRFASDFDSVPFYLEDRTGSVMIDPQGAEVDLFPTMSRTVRPGRNFKFEVLRRLRGRRESAPAGPISDEQLHAYAERFLARRELLGLTAGVPVDLGSRVVRVEERCILPDHWYDVCGTCVENPTPKGEQDRNLIKKGQDEKTFVITWKTEKQEESTLKWRAAKHIFGGAGLSVVCAAIILGKLGLLF